MALEGKILNDTSRSGGGRYGVFQYFRGVIGPGIIVGGLTAATIYTLISLGLLVVPLD
jgi:hypothetical protein